MSVVALGGATVGYGAVVALDGVTLSVDEGEYVAVLGPNGSGKSTFLKLIVGLVRPSSGSVAVFGRVDGKFDRKRVGYVPQVKGLDRTFPARAGELVASGLETRWPARSRANSQGVRNALEQVGALALADRSVASLSGGELQRVYLARSIARQPSLLLLDEPATGVDPVGEHDLYRVLDSYRAETGATIIMVTHDLEVARHHATRVVLLNRTLIGFGNPESVLTEAKLRSAFGHVGHAHTMMIGDR